jgi:hypothetical protein
LLIPKRAVACCKEIEPARGQIELNLRAEPSLRAKRKHVADKQHPDHQHWIDRGPAGVLRRKLLVHPTQIENAIDLADQMVSWHDLVEIKRIQELDLTIIPRPIMRRSRRCSSQSTESRFARAPMSD